MLPAVGEILNANPSAWRLSGEICFSAARRKIWALNDQSPEHFRWPAMLVDCRTQQSTVRAGTDKLRGGSWFRSYLYVLRFVDRASRYIYVIKTNLMHYLSTVYFVNQLLHFLGHICSPSSGGILYVYNNWYVLYTYSIQGRIKLFCALGSENISAPYFKQCFFRGEGVLPPQTVKHHASQSQDRNNKYFILYIEFCINNNI